MKRKTEQEVKDRCPDALAYSIKGAGEVLGGISEPLVRQLVKEGQLQEVQVTAKRKIIPRKSIENYLDRMLSAYETR